MQIVTPAQPVILPTGGVYPAAQLVSIAEPTPGAVLYFTIDGSTPTTSSPAYTAPFLVSTAQTVRAIAVAPGIPNSSVASESYLPVTAPTVLAASAMGVATPAATLHALVSTYGMAGSYWFTWGISASALTQTTAKTVLPGSPLGSRAGFAPVPVTAALSGLKAKTTYYFRAFATTAAGTSAGAILSFTTN